MTGLQFEPILARAERESGAFGLIDAGLRSRVTAMIDWVNERGPYRPDQIDAMQRQIHKLLVNRLLMALDRQRFPGIAAETIERPTFIIGFARSGTTLLHSLLAEDPEALALQSWNVLTPSPPPGAGPIASGRMASAQRAIEGWMDFCPGQRPLHPYIDKGAHQLCEDEEMLTLDFRYAYVYYLYEVPTLEGIVLSTDQANAYRFHREALQHFQWNTGRNRWVCKSPAAQHHLDAIFEVYPDARCIWAHRPISQIVASIVTLSTVIFDTIGGQAKDPSTFARGLAEGMKAAFDRLMANALIDDPRVMHIPFREISGDPMAAIRKIYRWLDLPVTGEFEGRVQAWLADPDNRVDRYGRYPYSYESVGLDRQWVEDLFADYSKRFGLN
jgi:hypothetical protein